MPTKLESLQARVREMEGVAYGRDRRESWVNNWAFQARRELRRRRRKMRAAQSRSRPQPTS
jgi:hypothetical protein